MTNPIPTLSEGAKRLAVQTSGAQGKGPSEGWSSLSLGVARVTQVYAPDLRCTIEIVVGENGRPTYTGVELLMPSVGSRHILGAIPEVGDYCVVGWFANNLAKAGKKAPAIISWMPRTPYLGHDWLTVQDFTPDEGVLETAKSRQELEYSANRTRFKLRHYDEGNVFASSSQGSDLVLDEGVLLSNRRANEIRLRDQDQAIVMRSVQQFHAMSGARVYGGLVQRDARSIPNDLVSDGTDWAASDQFDDIGLISNVGALPPSEVEAGLLTPHKIFLRGSAVSEDFKTEGGKIADYLNPYFFYEEMGLVDEEGRVLATSGEMYGGKSILRVNQSGESSLENALSEYRIEVNHLSDGTLPVTEQTDGLDHEKAVGSLPLVEFVLGSVVGNDPFTSRGSDLYGLPLGPKVVGAEVVLAPELEDTSLQSATLLQVNPLLDTQRPSFISMTKGGALYSEIGNTSAEAVVVNVEGGVQFKSGACDIGAGGDLGLFAGGGVEVASRGGAVKIVGEGYTGGVGGTQASVVIEARRGVSIQSGTGVVFSAPSVDFSNVKTLKFGATDSLVLKGGGSVVVQTSTLNEFVSGARKTTISGPTDGNPLNDQGVSEVIACSPATGSVGGVVKKETVTAGDVEQTTLTVGNRTTQVSLGHIVQRSLLGSVMIEAGLNMFTLSAESGASLTAFIGDVNFTSVAGSINLVATAGVNIRSVGPVAIQGSLVNLGGAGTAFGPILCGSDIDPVIGLPYSALGVLPRAQNLVII